MRRRRSTARRCSAQFWYITLPQLRGVIATVVLLDSIWTFRAFDPVFVMTGGGPAHASEVLATAIYFDGFQKLKFGYASAKPSSCSSFSSSSAPSTCGAR